ncbi:MAG: N-acetylneuraminate synthase family protein, partial [Salibacteraceae bacterium]|nr:N-acetylneuraminate synthase family protein [Salibacteraceae bacterium]
EMACAHNGSVQEAKDLIDAAVEARADAVQLQFFVADETVTPHHEAYSVVKRIEFDKETWTLLVNYAKAKNIHVWACTYDVPSVQLAVETACDGIKLNSADLSNPDVLKAVAASGIPFTLGTGASTKQEIESGIDLLKKNGASSCILMHGVQNFPTAIEDLHINRISWLHQNFPQPPVGYADHTEGENPFAKVVDLLAVAKGAAVIEKHITLDRSQKGIDYQAALEPAEYVDFVERIRKAYIALGSNQEGPFSESDLKYRKFQKKSVVAPRHINQGEISTRSDIKFIRNVEPGLAPVYFQKIEGRTANKAIQAYQNITEDDVNH